MSKTSEKNTSHQILSKLRSGPCFSHELGPVSHKVTDLISQLNGTLPVGWEIVGRWVHVPTRFGTTRERLYELRKPNAS